MNEPFSQALARPMAGLAKAIGELTSAIAGAANKHETETILCRIDKLETHIMAKLDELVAAATTLSTTADTLSIKVDALVAASDAVLAALQNADLPPPAVAALEKLKTATANASAEGDKVDAQVTKLDAVLPTPAPGGPLP